MTSVQIRKFSALIDALPTGVFDTTSFLATMLTSGEGEGGEGEGGRGEDHHNFVQTPILPSEIGGQLKDGLSSSLGLPSFPSSSSFSSPSSCYSSLSSFPTSFLADVWNPSASFLSSSAASSASPLDSSAVLHVDLSSLHYNSPSSFSSSSLSCSSSLLPVSNFCSSFSLVSLPTPPSSPRFSFSPVSRDSPCGESSPGRKRRKKADARLSLEPPSFLKRNGDVVVGYEEGRGRRMEDLEEKGEEREGEKGTGRINEQENGDVGGEAPPLKQDELLFGPKKPQRKRRLKEVDDDQMYRSPLSYSHRVLSSNEDGGECPSFDENFDDLSYCASSSSSSSSPSSSSFMARVERCEGFADGNDRFFSSPFSQGIEGHSHLERSPIISPLTTSSSTSSRGSFNLGDGEGGEGSSTSRGESGGRKSILKFDEDGDVGGSSEEMCQNDGLGRRMQTRMMNPVRSGSSSSKRKAARKNSPHSPQNTSVITAAVASGNCSAGGGGELAVKKKGLAEESTSGPFRNGRLEEKMWSNRSGLFDSLHLREGEWCDTIASCGGTASSSFTSSAPFVLSSPPHPSPSSLRRESSPSSSHYKLPAMNRFSEPSSLSPSCPSSYSSSPTLLYRVHPSYYSLPMSAASTPFVGVEVGETSHSSLLQSSCFSNVLPSSRLSPLSLTEDFTTTCIDAQRSLSPCTLLSEGTMGGASAAPLALSSDFSPPGRSLDGLVNGGAGGSDGWGGRMRRNSEDCLLLEGLNGQEGSSSTSSNIGTNSNATGGGGGTEWSSLLPEENIFFDHHQPSCTSRCGNTEAEDGEGLGTLLSSEGLKSRRETRQVVRRPEARPSLWMPDSLARHPNKPKVPKGEFNFFFFAEMLRLRSKYRLKPVSELTPLILERWKKMSDIEKQPYQEARRRDHERYGLEMEAFLKSADAQSARELAEKEEAERAAEERNSLKTGRVRLLVSASGKKIVLFPIQLSGQPEQLIAVDYAELCSSVLGIVREPTQVAVMKLMEQLEEKNREVAQLEQTIGEMMHVSSDLESEKNLNEELRRQLKMLGNEVDNNIQQIRDDPSAPTPLPFSALNSSPSSASTNHSSVTTPAEVNGASHFYQKDFLDRKSRYVARLHDVRNLLGNSYLDIYRRVSACTNSQQLSFWAEAFEETSEASSSSSEALASQLLLLASSDFFDNQSSSPFFQTSEGLSSLSSGLSSLSSSSSFSFSSSSFSSWPFSLDSLSSDSTRELLCLWSKSESNFAAAVSGSSSSNNCAPSSPPYGSCESNGTSSVINEGCCSRSTNNNISSVSLLPNISTYSHQCINNPLRPLPPRLCLFP